MILSEHIVDYEDIQFRNDDETLLSNRHIFVGVIHLSNDVDMDGNYLVFDSNIPSIFRSGMAEVGMKKRLKEHMNGNMRNNHANCSSKFYKCYSHLNTQVDNIPDKYDSLSTFQQLEQLLVIGINRNELTGVIKLFNWSPIECEELNNLQSVATRNTLPDKKYRHVYYLFECTYALDIDPGGNMSGNPGSEWQLKYDEC